MAVPFARDEAERGGECLVVESEQREELAAFVERKARQERAVIVIFTQLPHLPPLLQSPARALTSLQADGQVPVRC